MIDSEEEGGMGYSSGAAGAARGTELQDRPFGEASFADG